MSRDDGGHWLPIHSGLLDDERWMQSGRAREAWVILFLAADREADPGWFKDRARVAFLLRKHGLSKPDAQIDTLVRVGWLVSENADSLRLTLRGWHKYTGETYRKKVYNAGRGDRSEEYARRATTRAGRVRSVTERDGDVRRPRLDETRLETPGASAHEGPKPAAGVAKDLLKKYGYDPAIAPIPGQPDLVVE